MWAKLCLKPTKLRPKTEPELLLTSKKMITQPAITFSKLTIETPQQCTKSVKS